MLKTSLVAFGIVLASGGVALAQPASSDAGPPKPPPKPAGHHHRPPPPGGPVALHGKGFDLQLGHGRGLRVQCGDEPLKGCVQAAQPLIHALSKSMAHRPGGMMSGMHGGGMMGSGMMKQPAPPNGNAKPKSGTDNGSSAPPAASGSSKSQPSDSSEEPGQM